MNFSMYNGKTDDKASCDVSDLCHQAVIDAVRSGSRYDDHLKQAVDVYANRRRGIQLEVAYNAANASIMEMLLRSENTSNASNHMDGTDHFLARDFNFDPYPDKMCSGAVRRQAKNYYQRPRAQGNYMMPPASSLLMPEIPIARSLHSLCASSNSTLIPSLTCGPKLSPSFSNYGESTMPTSYHIPTIPMIMPKISIGSPPGQRTAISAPQMHFKTRPYTPLGTADDRKWLSDFNIFLRNECLEIIMATPEDVRSRRRSQQIKIGQVGIRCRFCAHLVHEERRNGSCVFPSKISTIYQRVTMMVKDHFPRCLEMPSDARVTFITLKDQSTRKQIQHGRSYWEESAMCIGIKDDKIRGLFMG